MRRKLTVAGLTGALVLGALGLAIADSTRITDPVDASDPSFDIVSAKAKHIDGKLLHLIKVAGQLDSGAPTSTWLQINLDGNRDDCEREIKWPPSGKVNIIKCGVGEANKVARVRKRNNRTLQFIFKEKAIGSPDKYGWRAIHGPDGADDAAPDETAGGQHRYVKHRLN